MSDKQNYNYGEDREDSSFYGAELDKELRNSMKEACEHREDHIEVMDEILKGDDTRKSRINALGTDILKKKYMSAEDKSPEDLFWRVAKVCSIPDVIDRMEERHKDLSETENKVINMISLSESNVFEPYTEEFNRVRHRRYGTDLRDTVDGFTEDELGDIWSKETRKYYDIIKDLDFMPASPTLLSAGRTGMLSSCFFMRPKDSLDNIFQVLKDTSAVMKAGGGVGLDFSEIRPEGSPVSNTNGSATGPISYMKIFNTMGDHVNQGSIRRSAMLASLRVDHPDIMKFITCKSTEGNLSNFNISVLVTDEFMEAVEGDKDIELRHESHTAKRSVSARSIWDKIVENAYNNGEPGVIFQDELDRGDLFKGEYGKFGVNPCLPGYATVNTPLNEVKIEDLKVGEKIWAERGWTTVLDVWVSGEKTVYRYETEVGYFYSTKDHKVVVDGKKIEVDKAEYLERLTIPISDYKKPIRSVKCKIIGREEVGVEKVYDLTVDNESHTFRCCGFNTSNCGELPLLEYASCNLASINLAQCYTISSGVGTEGKIRRVDWAKLEQLVRLGIRFLDNVVDLNNYPLHEIETATLRDRKIGLGCTGLHDLMLHCGVKYSGTDEKSIKFIEKLYRSIRKWAINESIQLGKTRGVPNYIKDISGGQRNISVMTAQPCGTVSMICNQVSSGIEPVFQWSYTRKDTFGTHEMEHFMLKRGKLPDYAQTALEIPPEEHVKVQSILQKYIDLSISKTINMPYNATMHDVESTIKEAYRLKCKSITLYRSGSREQEVLVDKEKKVKEEKAVDVTAPRIRPRFLPGITFKTNTPGGKAYVTINEDKEGIREVFIHISKAGSEIGSHVESEGRLISFALKHRNPVSRLIKHMIGQKSTPVWENGRSIKSVPDAVGKVMEEYISRFEGFSEYMEDYGVEESTEKHDEQELTGDICMECGEVLYRESGCDVCKSCGYSTCG